VITVDSGILRCSICLYASLSHTSIFGIKSSGLIFSISIALYPSELIVELFTSASVVVQLSHFVISVSDCFASDVVSAWLSTGVSASEVLLSFSLNAANN
jgi:hypothetical protein